jgi:hypothetical protein
MEKLLVATRNKDKLLEIMAVGWLTLCKKWYDLMRTELM